MKRIALILAAVLLGLGLAWFVRQVRSAEELSERVADGSVETPATVVDSASAMESTLATRPSRTDREAVESRDVASKTAEESFTLVVVDGRSGEPVAGAELMWMEQERVEPADVALLEFEVSNFQEFIATKPLAQIEELTRLHGHRALSDSNGHVELPISTWPLLFGSKEELVGGSDTFWTEEDMPTLRLWPDGDLRARLLEADGTACVGAEVRLIEDFGDWSSVELVASTDASGMATLAHGFVCIASNDARSIDPRRKWRIAAAALPDRQGSVDLEPTALPREPVEIRLAAAGSVELVVLDTTGVKFTGELPVTLSEIDVDNSPADPRNLRIFRPGWYPRTKQLIARNVDGTALFEHVGVGTQLIAMTSRNEASSINLLRFAGPTRAGERVRCEMRLGSESVVLTARLQDPEGVPLASIFVAVRLFAGPSPDRLRFTHVFENEPMTVASSKLLTDAQGRLTVEYALDSVFQGRPLLVITRPRSERIMLERCLDLQELWTAGPHDLGEIRIEEAPILAAGVVVDDSGAPVVEADVSISPSESGMHMTREYPTDEYGRFEIRSAKPHATVDIRAEKEGFASSYENDGQPGRTDWRIELRRASRLIVRVNFPAGSTSHDFSVSLHHVENGVVEENSYVSGGLREDGIFEWDKCAPGSYALFVRTVDGFDSKTVAKLENLVVRNGETTDAGVIDLSGGASFVSLSVLDPSGKPLDGGAYAAGSDSTGLIDELWSAHWGKEIEDGKLRLAREGAVLNVAVAAPGARTRVFTDVHDGDVLQLESGIPIALAIANTISRPAKGQTLQAGLVRQGLDPRARVMSPLRWYTGEFDERGEARLVAPEPGRYVLRWMLVRKHLGGSELREWHDDPSVIEILDSGELQRFEVRCPIDPATAWDSR